MAVSGRRRFDDDKVVRYETTEKDYEVEVSRTLNKWCVTVYQLPDRQILVQDFFPERWKALARAQDFIRLLNQRKKKEEEALGGGSVEPLNFTPRELGFLQAGVGRGHLCADRCRGHDRRAAGSVPGRRRPRTGQRQRSKHRHLGA